jgi:DNA-binding GntR family transcriptional regulator
MNENVIIPRRSLHDQLAERLREMIVEGEFADSEKINEISLTEMFGVSRTPLREALKILVAEGLLAHTPNRGFQVLPLTEKDIAEVFPIIGAIEALAGEFACENITDEELGEIRQLHQEMRGHFENNNLQSYFRCNQAIHAAILKASRNTVLIHTHTGLSGRIKRARYAANLSGNRWHQAMQEHEEILAALENRDKDRLPKLLRVHLEHKFDSLRQRSSG